MRLLLTQPHRFSFDAALRVLMRARRVRDPAEAARFRSQAGRSHPAGEIIAVEKSTGADTPRVTVALLGLIGAGGVLPRLYEVLAGESARRGSSALHDFIDLLSHRMVGYFGRSGIKYRLHRSAEVASLTTPAAPDPVAQALLALTGYATPGLTERLEAGVDPLLHYAGLFAMRPRSAERLAALVSDWFGRPVKVRQFAGEWLTLPADQQTTLPRLGYDGTWNRLGIDAAIGDRSWDVQARIVLCIGPLLRAEFEALLPDQPAFRRLVSLVQAFLGLETRFAINPVLAREAATPLQLTDAANPRLGWNTWVNQPETQRHGGATDASFDVA
jgi:type VI secretion system protein ImpH